MITNEKGAGMQKETTATRVSRIPLVPAANQIPTKCLHWLVTLPWMQEEIVLREKMITETELQSQ